MPRGRAAKLTKKAARAKARAKARAASAAAAPPAAPGAASGAVGGGAAQAALKRMSPAGPCPNGLDLAMFVREQEAAVQRCADFTLTTFGGCLLAAFESLPFALAIVPELQETVGQLFLMSGANGGQMGELNGRMIDMSVVTGMDQSQWHSWRPDERDGHSGRAVHKAVKDARPMGAASFRNMMLARCFDLELSLEGATRCFTAAQEARSSEDIDREIAKLQEARRQMCFLLCPRPEWYIGGRLWRVGQRKTLLTNILIAEGEAHLRRCKPAEGGRHTSPPAGTVPTWHAQWAKDSEGDEEPLCEAPYSAPAAPVARYLAVRHDVESAAILFKCALQIDEELGSAAGGLERALSRYEACAGKNLDTGALEVDARGVIGSTVELFPTWIWEFLMEMQQAGRTLTVGRLCGLGSKAQ